MSQLFEELFLMWCVPYDQNRVPEYLKDDPVRAYGQYAFEAGFKLAMQLAVSSLDPDVLAKTE